jgi:hypothetical protein
MSWRELAPEPATLWARWLPRTWPATSRGHAGPAAEQPRGSGAPLDAELPTSPPADPEVTYLPPVPAAARTARDELAAAIVGGGGHALVHLELDEPRERRRGETCVIDLLEPILAEARGELASESIPGTDGAWVVLPLLPGVPVAGVDGWRLWLDRLANAGAIGAVAVPWQLSTRERRDLADRAPESHWEALFHGVPPSESEVAREIARRGLGLLPPRPEIDFPPRRSRNRRIATHLLAVAALGEMVGESEAVAAELRAAARRVEGSSFDVEALAREGNLELLEWLGPVALDLTSEVARDGRSDRIEALEAQLRNSARRA